MRREKRIRANERRDREMGEGECSVGSGWKQPKRKGGLQGVKREKCGREDVKAEREKKNKEKKENGTTGMNSN